MKLGHKPEQVDEKRSPIGRLYCGPESGCGREFCVDFGRESVTHSVWGHQRCVWWTPTFALSVRGNFRNSPKIKERQSDPLLRTNFFARQSDPCLSWPWWTNFFDPFFKKELRFSVSEPAKVPEIDRKSEDF